MQRNTSLPDTKLSGSLKERYINGKYTGIEPFEKQWMINILKLNSNATDMEILSKADTLLSLNNDIEENIRLKNTLAKLAIDNAINNGFLDANDRESFIKLAAKEYDITIDVINQKHQKSLELQNLLKLSGRELYLEGKLQRLKQLSESHYQLKFEELSNFDYSAIPSESRPTNEGAVPMDELEGLTRLSGRELYLEGKLERLKQLDFSVFQLKYKEFFHEDFK